LKPPPNLPRGVRLKMELVLNFYVSNQLYLFWF
jgi:hypothetical protein